MPAVTLPTGIQAMPAGAFGCRFAYGSSGGSPAQMPGFNPVVGLLGVLLNAKPLFVLTPVFIGSLLLTGMAVAFNRLHALPERYPHHWL